MDIGIKSWLNCVEKLSFFGSWKVLSAGSKSRKPHLYKYRISKFSGGKCPWIPLGGKALLHLAVPISLPQVSNPLALINTLMKPLCICLELQASRCDISDLPTWQGWTYGQTDRQTDGWTDRQTILFCIRMIYRIYSNKCPTSNYRPPRISAHPKGRKS